jgi:hypothetical protein
MPTETTRETKRPTEATDETLIAIFVSQLDGNAPTTIDIDISTIDPLTSEEISGKHIAAEREGLIPALNALGGYLQIVATRMAHEIVDRATQDPGLAKEIGLENV